MLCGNHSPFCAPAVPGQQWCFGRDQTGSFHSTTGSVLGPMIFPPMVGFGNRCLGDCLCPGRNGYGRAPDARRTRGERAPDARRTRTEPFLPEGVRGNPGATAGLHPASGEYKGRQ
eukprot:gene14405-biopygen2071